MVINFCIRNGIITTILLLLMASLSCSNETSLHDKDRESKSNQLAEILEKNEQVENPASELPISDTIPPEDINSPILEPESPPFATPNSPIFPAPPALGVAVDDFDFDNEEDDDECQLGSALFRTIDPDDWYEIITMPFPDITTLSLNRNKGFTEGDVDLTPSGLLVGEAGSYWASFSAFVMNTDPMVTPIIPTFLASNNTFDPLSTDDFVQIASVGIATANQVTVIEGSGILHDVTAGTSLSIIVTNAGGPSPEPVTVISWMISIYKICD